MLDPSFRAVYKQPSPLEAALEMAQAAQTAQAGAETVADGLRVSELRYRRLFETARDGILILDGEYGGIIDANPFIIELLGYTLDELIGKELWEIGLLRDKQASQTAFRQLEREGHIRYEDMPLKNRHGQKREVEFVSNVYREGWQSVIQCNIRDITERKALEKQLAAAQAQYKNIALALQRPILFQPKEDAFSGLMVQTAYVTASDEALVGGDFWDTFAYDHGHVALVLGDVMGHGLSSAIFTTELKHTMRAYIREHEQPGRVLQQMNQFLCQSNRLFLDGVNSEGSDTPVCIALVVVERGTGIGTLSLAGMQPPIVICASGKTEQLPAVGVPLGIFANETYAQVDFQLEPGDTLIISTDGITEARREKTFLDVEGMIRLAVAGSAGSLKDMAETILNGARDFAGGTPRDDASVVLVRRSATAPHIENP